MGYMRHHAIVLTSWDITKLREVHGAAVNLFAQTFGTGYGAMQVSEIIESPINGYHSFFIPPDGSKEGWDASNSGDARREEFKALLRTYERGYIDWAEVQYGDDENETVIIGHSDTETASTGGSTP